MELFVNTSAQQLNQALVNSASDLTSISRLPDLVFGDSEPLTIKFLSAASTYASWSGGGGYVLSVSVGEIGTDGDKAYVQTTDFDAIANGWSGRLSLTGAALAAALLVRPKPQLWIQIRVTDSDGNTETFAQRPIVVSGAVSVPDTEDSTPIAYATYEDALAAVTAAESAQTAAQAAQAAAEAAQAAAEAAAAPSNPTTTAGDLIVRGATELNRLPVGTNGQVLKVVSGAPAWAEDAGGMTNPMTTPGDLIAGGTAGAPTRIAAGTDGQVLKIVSGAPAWATDNEGSGGMANPMTTAGDLIVGGASGAPTRLPIGSNGQVLKVVSGALGFANETGGGGGAPDDGWKTSSDTWTYATATTFTIAGDVTATFKKGDKLKFTQSGSAKYAYVVSVAYSAPNTTITITAGSDYSLTNAAISDTYYSDIGNPAAFPEWFNWSPTVTGFSVLPTGAVYKFRLSARACEVVIRHGGSGTSNSTAFTLTAPVRAAAVTDMWWLDGAMVTNSGTVGTGYLEIEQNTQTIIVLWSASGTSFTASGAKRVNGGQFVYEW